MNQHVLVRAVTVIVAALSVLLVGCGAPSPGAVLRQTVHTVHDEAEGVTAEQRDQREARDVAVLEWAVEAGHQEPVTADELRELHQQGTDGYGPTELSFWNFYQEWLAQVEERLRSAIRDDLSVEEVRAYYDEHLEQFERQDTIVVTVVPWWDNRAGEAYEVTIDEGNVRRLQEADDALVAAALPLQAGERVVIDQPDGTQLQVICDSRTDAGVIPFDEVAQAAASQLATQRYTEELERRTRS